MKILHVYVMMHHGKSYIVISTTRFCYRLRERERGREGEGERERERERER